MRKQIKTIKDENEAKGFAGEFSKKLKKGDVVELSGDLGSGKTFFARSLSEHLGAKGASSPSFVIKNEYKGAEFPVLHFDFYRLETPDETYEELRDNLSSKNSLIIVEWADKLQDILPDDRYKIHFKVTGDNSRELTITK